MDHYQELILAHSAGPHGIEWLDAIELEALQQAATEFQPMGLPPRLDMVWWTPVSLGCDEIVWMDGEDEPGCGPDVITDRSGRFLRAEE